jgi:transcriptional regulator with XRE-family HTH domain
VREGTRVVRIAPSGGPGSPLRGISSEVGDRLREVRREKGLSLHDVQARSALEFKASALGAYERGERVISLPRLLRLARLYGVPVEELLPREVGVEIDLTETAEAEPEARYMVDLNRLAKTDDPDAAVLLRFVAEIQRRREERHSPLVTIRASDVRILAAALGRTPEELQAYGEPRPARSRR